MSRFQPLLSTTALLLALVGQGTALVHMGVVRHERCAEHGELVDVVAVPGSGAGADADGQHGLDEIGDSAGDDDHAGDDHCVLAFCATSVPDVTVSVADVDAVVIVAAVVSGLRPADGVAAHAVLDVAPKTSPPRA